MSSIIIVIIAIVALGVSISIFGEGRSNYKLWGSLALFVSIAIWVWLGIAASCSNTIQSVKVYNIDTISDDSKVVFVDGSRIINLNVEMGRNIPPDVKAKRTVWNGVYIGIDFKIDPTKGSLKDTWELVKE